MFLGCLKRQKDTKCIPGTVFGVSAPDGGVARDRQGDRHREPHTEKINTELYNGKKVLKGENW